MSRVLVDTSVWVDHFRQSNKPLIDLLILDGVAMHPLIIGELACGTPPNRAQTLSDLHNLQSTQQATLPETLGFIERECLFGLGCGLIDLLLLTSALITPNTQLWTLDKRLHQLAQRFGVAYSPAKH